MLLLKLPQAADLYGVSTERGTRPAAVFFMIEREKGNGNHKDHGIGCLLLSTIDFYKLR